MNLDEIKKIVDEEYSGNTDMFLFNLRSKTILFLISGGFCFLSALALLKVGIIPILTPIIGSVFFIIGVILHRVYNKCNRLLKH